MTVRVELTCKCDIPRPNPPDSLEGYSNVTASTFDGDDWTWNGTNVTLIRTPGTKMVGEQMHLLSSYYAAKILRPLQACELFQLLEFSDHWPDHWRDNKGGGRIFFGGTVYALEYKDRPTAGLVWYAWFDSSDAQWVFHCAPTNAMLRPGDEFACIGYDPSLPIADYSPKRGLAPQRREREATIPRSLLGVIR